MDRKGRMHPVVLDNAVSPDPAAELGYGIRRPREFVDDIRREVLLLFANPAQEGRNIDGRTYGRMGLIHPPEELEVLPAVRIGAKIDFTHVKKITPLRIRP
jgi:hypothetical protein